MPRQQLKKQQVSLPPTANNSCIIHVQRCSYTLTICIVISPVTRKNVLIELNA